MNNQLVRKEDVSVFDKIRAFFKGLFSKKENKVEEVKNNIEIAEVKEKEQIKEKKSDFIQVIEKHPERIDNLSDDVLDRLIRYYRKITSTKKARIKELRGI